MKHLFVPVEIAKRMKQIGFDVPMFGCYWDNLNKLTILDTPITYTQFDVYNKDNNALNDEVLVPLYQQVVDWLAENHFADCYTTPVLSTMPKHYESHLLFRGVHKSFGVYPSAKDALDKAIEEAIKLI